MLSAWEPEIAPLRRMARRAIASGQVALRAVGIGAIDAAAGAARAIASWRPDSVIFVGTAGFYGRARKGVALERPVAAGPMVFVSTAALRAEAYLPAPMLTRHSPDAALTALLASFTDAPPQTVACPLAITRTGPLAHRISAATGASVENLEAFAVARASAQAGLPMAAVLGISNRVGRRSHPEWVAHHVAASTAACRVVALIFTKNIRG